MASCTVLDRLLTPYNILFLGLLSEDRITKTVFLRTYVYCLCMHTELQDTVGDTQVGSYGSPKANVNSQQYITACFFHLLLAVVRLRIIVLHYAANVSWGTWLTSSLSNNSDCIDFFGFCLDILQTHNPKSNCTLSFGCIRVLDVFNF